MNVKINTNVPDGLLKALQRRNLSLHHADAQSVFYCVWLWSNNFCGVFGDGDNAAYEWFVWKDDCRLETSDCGYGDASVALRDVLNSSRAK